MTEAERLPHVGGEGMKSTLARAAAPTPIPEIDFGGRRGPGTGGRQRRGRNGGTAKTQRTRENYRRRRLRVFAEDGWACVFCGSKTNLTLDHIVPKSRGGSGRRENLQTLCAPCNRRKADRLGAGRPGPAPSGSRGHAPAETTAA